MEYPDKNFPNSSQIGWIADQIVEIVPELVVEDTKGYKSVAYARATALLGSAIKELRDDMMMEINIVKKEISELKEILAKMQM
jgi:hypothetical protein